MVKPAESAAEVRRRLGEFGSVEQVEGSDLLLLRLDSASPDLRATRRRILDLLEAVQWAEPLLLDEKKGRHFPTGDVSVRFRHPLSDEELDRFAAEHRLRLQRRNEFVPEQATFEPLDARRTYLSDVLRSLRKAQNVAEAWAGTVSRYRRS